MSEVPLYQANDTCQDIAPHLCFFYPSSSDGVTDGLRMCVRNHGYLSRSNGAEFVVDHSWRGLRLTKKKKMGSNLISERSQADPRALRYRDYSK